MHGKRVTLIGHGYVGSAIARALDANKITYRWISHGWPDVSGDVIINAAGYTGNPNVDACELPENMARCFDGNALWPSMLETMAGDIPVIHIGSGCVYQGSGPFKEDDRPNFTGSFYSFSKVVGQRVLEPYLAKSYLLRIRMPFSEYPHPKNLLTKLMAYDKLVDVENSVSCLEDVVKTVLYFAITLPPPGVYNVVNPGSVTTGQIADILGLRKEWFESEEAFLRTVQAPRSNCVLSTDKLESVFPLRSAETALRDCAKWFRKRISLRGRNALQSSE